MARAIDRNAAKLSLRISVYCYGARPNRGIAGYRAGAVCTNVHYPEGGLMRRNMRLLVCSMAVAGCFAGAQASVASAALPTLPLVVKCTPRGCIAAGVFGSLFGETFLSPRFSEGIICVGRNCEGGTLVFAPRFIGASVFGRLRLGASLAITPRSLLALGRAGPFGVFLKASNGAAGLILFKPGRPICVGVSLTRIFAQRC